jgi:hypothetical protein
VHKSTAKKSLIFVADARTGRPVVGQSVRFYTEKDRSWSETTKTTNADGVIDTSLKSGSYGATALAVSPKGGLAVAQFYGQDSSAEEKSHEVAMRLRIAPFIARGTRYTFVCGCVNWPTARTCRHAGISQ